MQLILIPYFVIASLFGLYFNWIYANTQGFTAWLFFGEVVATIQGFLWPIYLLTGNTIF